MTDQQPTTPLSAILNNDQLEAELNAVIRPIAAAFKMLTGTGMPPEAAASIAESYGDYRMSRHFGIPMMPIQIYTGEDE